MVEKQWSDLLQILTEDENLRIRKGDIVSLERTDIVDFMRNLKLFETRMESLAQKIKDQHAGN